MMAQDWCFISSNQDGKAPKDADSRKLIRANAMKAFRRTQRQERMKTFKKKETRTSRRKAGDQELDLSRKDPKTEAPPAAKPLATPEPSSPGDLAIVGWKSSKHPPELDDVKVSLDFPSPPRSISPYAGLVTQCDPFSVTALGGHGRLELFQHFVSDIAPILQPIPSKSPSRLSTLWARHALEDPVLLEALYYHSSVHLDERQGKTSSSASTIYHKGESIRLLNERLANPELAVDDATIGAVGLLGASGNINGDTFGDAIHKQALSKMVEMRGGLKHLGWDGSLATLLSIGDNISSTISSTPPSLSSPSLTSSPSPHSSPKSSPKSTFSSAHSSPQPSSASSTQTEFSLELSPQEVFSSLQTIRHLIDIQSLITKNSSASQNEVDKFNTSCLSIEHHLLSLQSPTDTDHLHGLIYEAARIAASISLTLHFRFLRHNSSMFVALSNKLMLLLTEITSIVTLQTTTPQDGHIPPSSFTYFGITKQETQLLLWVSVVGGLVTMDKEWFVNKIIFYLVKLGYGSWVEVVECLGQFCWSERMQDACCGAILALGMMCNLT